MAVVTTFIVLITLYVYALAVVSPWGETDRDSDEGSHEPFFVLLVPALNEERVIGRTIASLLELRGRFLAIVVDDGSDDGTVATVAPFLADPRLRLLEQPRSRHDAAKATPSMPHTPRYNAWVSPEPRRRGRLRNGQARRARGGGSYRHTDTILRT